MKYRGALPGAYELCVDQGMIPPGSTVLCAVSGGADSICLLHWLHHLRALHPFTLVAAHYDHGLRGAESRRDAAFVRSFLAQCCGPVRVHTPGGVRELPQVELIEEQGDVAAEARRRRQGVEETARDLRYAFLRRAAQQAGAELIATAHNANDNAETVLLDLARGCGLQGLTGIPPRRDGLIRPLLTTPRADIEAYLHGHGLPHVEDRSNADMQYARNRLRHQVLPVLTDLQPKFIEHVTLTTQRLAQDEAFLTGLARSALPPRTPVPDGLALDAAAIAAQPDALAVRMVRLALDELTRDGGQCSAAHLHAVTALCRGDDPSAACSLPGGVLARRVYGRLELVYHRPDPVFSPVPLPLPGEAELPFGRLTARPAVYAGQPQTPFSFYLSGAKTAPGLTVRPRLTGDALARPGRPRRTLKKLMIDEKIPRHLRGRLPVLDCGGQVAGAAGLGPDANVLPAQGEPCWHIQYTPHPEKGSHLHGRNGT